MAAGVATIGRRKFAVGLYWQPSPSGRVAQAAKETARQQGETADFYSIRPGVKGGRIAQFGLGQEDAGHRMGMPALAATLANKQPGSWAGAFKVNEGFVVIVVRDDLITPDGDQIFLDEAAARDKLVQEFILGGLGKIFAPEAWAISGAETVALPFLIQSSADGALKPVAIPRSVIVGGAGLVAVLLIAMLGLWFYQKMKAEEERKRQEMLRQQAEAMRAQQAQVGQIVYPPPVRYWEDEPLPMAVIKACLQAMEQVPLTYLGWGMPTMTCDRSALSLSWARVSNTHTMVIEQANIDPSGATAGRSVAWPELPKRDKEDLLDPAEITRRFLGQNWQATLSRLPDDPPPPRPPEVPPEQWNPPPPPWVKRGFNATLTDMPGQLPRYLEGIPGVIIKSASKQSGAWNVEGVIYENRR
jgi:hypothetical protein